MNRKFTCIPLLFSGRFIFFTKWTVIGSLERANLDGSNQTTLVSHKIIYPCGLTVDLPNAHVYWVDTYMDSVERVDYDGKKRWSLKKSTTNYPFIKSLHSVAIFEGTVFVSSWSPVSQNQSVVALNKRNSDNAHWIVKNVTRPDNLRIFHNQRQPQVAHPCGNGGGCAHICITAWKKGLPVGQCMCAPGYRLQGKSNCVLIKHPSFLIYAKQKPGMIKGISMSQTMQPGGGNQEAIVPILNVQWPLSLDYNVKEELIYFGQNDRDGTEFIIEAQKLDGSGRFVVLRGPDHCHGIAYDWIGNNMFWASSNKIVVFSLANTNISKTLIYTLNTG